MNGTRNIASFGVVMILLVCGCATTRNIANTPGDTATLRVQLVNDRMPAPRIYWSESPRYSENMLTIEPKLPGCEIVNFYVNPSSKRQNRLGDYVLKVTPIDGAKSFDALKYWEYISDKECAVLILALHHSQVDSEGLWLVTESGQTDVITTDLPENNPGSAFDVLAPFAVVLLPVHVVVGVTAIEIANVIPRGDIPVPSDMCVSFEFAGGRVVETTLGWGEALRLLKGPYFIEDEYFKADRYHPYRIRNWIRAALLKLELDFREESPKSTLETQDWSPGNSKIVSIDKNIGEWLVQTSDAEAPKDQRQASAQDADFIRLIWFEN